MKNITGSLYLLDSCDYIWMKTVSADLITFAYLSSTGTVQTLRQGER